MLQLGRDTARSWRSRRRARVPGARLNETVTACSWPTWLIAVGPTVRSTVAKLDSGTSAPLCRAHVDVVERALVLLAPGVDLHDHLVAVDRRCRSSRPGARRRRCRAPCGSRRSSTPSVLARSRSILSDACRPFSCESLVTSRKHRVGAHLVLQLAPPSRSARRRCTLCRMYWYWLLLGRPPSCRFWIGCM